MESLRTRKASVNRSKSKLSKQSSRTPTGAPNANGRPPASKPKDARKSRVDDKIKKRMSMRYADISGPTNVAAVPSVPSIPIGLRPSGGQVPARRGRGRDTIDEEEEEEEVVKDRGPSLEEIKAADNKLLDVDEFDPDAFLKVKMSNATEAELKSMQSSLQASKDSVAQDLQRNVFKNYAEFVLISKEISNLENEMLELKESLAEWKSMPSLLHIDESNSVADRRRNVRSSVADLRVLYASQMQSLHTQIEGSTKFVPTTPGRHVICEMDAQALNAATYKAVGGVRFVVLDDAVLVARRRKRRDAGGGGGGGGGGGQDGGGDRLVAERCWALNEMLVLDTKDTATMTNVFKIKHVKEVSVYRTESSADKKSLLSQLRHVAEELAAKRRKEREGEHEQRKTLFAGDRSSLAFAADGPDWMADLARRAGMGEGAKEKHDRDMRWVSDFCDDLTVSIALRSYDDAVLLVEQGQAKLSITPSLSTKLPALTSSLTTALLEALSDPGNGKTKVVHLIGLLVRLGKGAEARVAFLRARREVVRRLVRMLRFEGHVGMYVHDLATVVFTAVKHTADWFLASYKENEVASCFIEWAKGEMETYAEMFRKQVYSSDVDQKTIDEALKITYAQSRKLLQEYGLDFRFLLNELLVRDPKAKPDSKAQLANSSTTTTSSSSAKKSSTAPTVTAPIPPSTPTPPVRSPTPSSASQSQTQQSLSAQPPLPTTSSSSASTPRSPTPRSPRPTHALASMASFTSASTTNSSTSSASTRTPPSPSTTPTPHSRSNSPAPSSSSHRRREREREREGLGSPKVPPPVPPIPVSPTPVRATAQDANGNGGRPSRSARTSPAPSMTGSGVVGAGAGVGPVPVPPRSRDRPGSASGRDRDRDREGARTPGGGRERDREGARTPGSAVPRRMNKF